MREQVEPSPAEEPLEVLPSELARAVVDELLSYFDGLAPGSPAIPEWRAISISERVLARLISRPDRR